ncbi:hypothetical protein [Neisseria sicca]|uniref:hypothetical protein n=1 Tax=Neisseria sicca TaxID=490 RepID=UPI003F689C3F
MDAHEGSRVPCAFIVKRSSENGQRRIRRRFAAAAEILFKESQHEKMASGVAGFIFVSDLVLRRSGRGRVEQSTCRRSRVDGNPPAAYFCRFAGRRGTFRQRRGVAGIV